VILTEGPKQIPFAPLPLEWLTPEMLEVFPASPAHLWTYLWSLTDHATGCLRTKQDVYHHEDAARVLRTNERTIRRWFADIEASGWMESVRVRSGLRFRMRRTRPLGQPTGYQKRTPESVSDLVADGPKRTPESVSDRERTPPPASDSEADICVRVNGHQSPSLPDADSERFRNGGGGPRDIVVRGGQESTPSGPPPVDRPAPVTPPVSKSSAGAGTEAAYYRTTDRVASELGEYLGQVALDPGVRRTLAYELHDRSLALQREVVLTAAATFKQEGFKYVGVPQYWHDRLAEATSKVEARQRQRDAALWKGYAPDDTRYPAPTESEAHRQRARELLAQIAPTMLGAWDPVARRTVPVPVSLRPIGDDFATVKATLKALPQLRPPAAPPAPTEGDAA